MSSHKIISLLLIISFLNILTLSIVDRTFFNYLGLKISASKQDVENAYKQKRQKIQHIQDQKEKQRKIKLLQSAYNALSNQKQREKYQRYGKDAFKNIKQITSINQYTKADSRKGKKINLKIPITIQDLYNGTTVKALYETRQACSKCMGTGAQSPKHIKTCDVCGAKGFSMVDGVNQYGQPQKYQGLCPHCKGTGKKVQKQCNVCHGHKIIDALKTLQIKIPSKFEGKQLLLKNYGPEQQLGAPSDFLVHIEQVPSKVWQRNGQNLIYTLEITLQQSIFGFRKVIKHLSGQQIVIERHQITPKQTKIPFIGKGFSSKGRLTVEFKMIHQKFSDQQLDMWQSFFKKYQL